MPKSATTVGCPCSAAGVHRFVKSAVIILDEEHSQWKLGNLNHFTDIEVQKCAWAKLLGSWWIRESCRRSAGETLHECRTQVRVDITTLVQWDSTSRAPKDVEMVCSKSRPCLIAEGQWWCFQPSQRTEVWEGKCWKTKQVDYVFGHAKTGSQKRASWL